MNHTTSILFLIQHWRLFAMADGYTLHNTVIDTEPVEGGYLPAFTGAYGTRVVVDMAKPMPTEEAARNCLRDVLWGAHIEGRICLLRHPLEANATQEQAA
ncbi:hypothetical protein [Vreelandella janggokensis]|uniref:hypothetical protein n=1 Tax=Vreelandella janggokensis TaxID=370767 RepID=UPI00285EFD41|nr:hypothetical protein [Halomonas janggokensis]MDR5887530.1 hypothetical protein [Halomonas janggokensis]